MRPVAAAGLALLLPLITAPALRGAEAGCPPVQPAASRGLTVRAAVGPSFWLGEVGGQGRPGLAAAFAVGYEFLSWLGLEAAWHGGIHDTDQPAPPTPGSFATHALHGAVRLGVPLGSFDVYLRGGAGLILVEPNILVRLDGFDARWHLSWLGEAGFAWHAPQRGLWIGLEVSTLGAPGFPGVLLATAGQIGVTF